MKLSLKGFTGAAAIAICILFSGCLQSPYFQKDIAIPQNSWKYDFQPSFKVDLKDSSALYNMYFVIRHTEAYPYSNIWLWVHTKQPGDSTFERSRIEIPLAETSGKWLGRGMGEIWEQRMPITSKPLSFKRSGTYEIRFEQDMRVNPLPEVLQVALRVEKVGYLKAR